ncbi:glycosyltransferase, GT2 family [Desulfuromonas soudanensis]|uniref:Glycosyltransferase, GT2 family n=2 Tax=Desulfuromonas soudanensis TaxID=1603606 RepID=A0A0M4D357_9BACT|nr:glycosyltransferase, GT2 family [Desulfuromonas soudanensis]
MVTSFPFVSIVIPVFNEERYLADCLNSLMELSYPKEMFQIILVDNGSSDGTIDIARRYPINIFVKEKSKVGGVRNFGATKAKGEILVFLDSDCSVDSNWLTNGIEKFKGGEGLVIGGQYLTRDNPSWIEKYWVLNNSKKIIHQTTLVGGCIFIPKEIFHKINGFDETLNSGEDSDITYRLRLKGYIVKIDPSLSVVHLGYPTTLISFIKRQIWHSADYIKKIPSSLNDKIFLLCCVFIFSIFGSVISFIFNFYVFFMFIAVIIFAPALLSFKRLRRSRAHIDGLYGLISVYFVDFLYLIGRSIGVVNGIKNLFIQIPEKKIDRR